MTDANGRARDRDIERLRSLLDRLGASDITLAEAKALRESVHDLLAERAPASARVGRTNPPRCRGGVRAH